MENRRSTPRRKTFKTGMIVSHGSFLTINCLVRNVSDSGARLELESALPLPREFELLFNGQSRWCQAIWKAARHIGVRFT